MPKISGRRSGGPSRSFGRRAVVDLVAYKKARWFYENVFSKEDPPLSFERCYLMEVGLREKAAPSRARKGSSSL